MSPKQPEPSSAIRPLKRRMAFACVLFLALWPFIHHWMVTTYEMDPWMYFGVSMYTRPRPIARVSALETARPGQPFQLLLVRDFAEPSRSMVTRRVRLLARGVAASGRLYRPAGVVEEIFQLLPPEVDRLAFTIERLELGPDARLASRLARTECSRSGPSCTIVR